MKLFSEKKLLNEGNQGVTIPSMEQLDSGKGLMTLYRVAFKDQIESIFKYGYNRGWTGKKGGNMYGPGVYCTSNLQDSIYNVKTKPHYGNCIVQMRLADGFKNFIIFNETFAKQTYGNNWTIKDQLINIAGFEPKIAEKVERECSYCSNLYHGRTAPAALHIWRTYRKDIFLKHHVRGLIYKGENDGHCALPYDFSSIIPYAVSFDQGVSFTKKLTDEGYQFMKEHADVEFVFGGEYKSFQQSVKGYTMVQRFDNKYNVIKNETKKPISPIWFDEIVGQIEPTTGRFGFYYKGYEFLGSIFPPPGENSNLGCVLDPFEGEPCCDFSDLDNIIAEMKRLNIKTFDDFYELKSQEEGNEDDDQLSETKRKVGTIIENIVRKQIYSVLNEEHLKVVDNIKELIDFVEQNWTSPDDMWWIKIDSRLKDFKSYNRRNPKKRQKYWMQVNHTDGTRRENHVGYVIVRGRTREACVDSIKNAVVHLNPWAARIFGSKTVYSNGNAEALKTVCNNFFARSYITINKRSINKTVKISKLDRQKGIIFKGREFHHRAGQTKTGVDYTGQDWSKERPLGLIDCDIDDATAQAKLENYLKQNNVRILFKKPSHDGMHYVTYIDDVKGLDFSFLDKYATNNRPGDPNVLFKPDANLIVYSAVG